MSAASVAAICQRIGRRVPVWTQGAGGNVSRKTGDGILWIKASGMRLDAVSESEGLAQAKLDSLVRRLGAIAGEGEKAEHDYARALADESRAGPGLGRLSMEAGFHALLPSQWVIHFHALTALLMAREAGRNEPRMREWLSRSSRRQVEFLPATMPGLELSRAVARVSHAKIFVLANHGVILHAADESILDEWSELERAFCQAWGFEELDRLLAAMDVLTEARASHGDTPCPLRYYFPDSAVFAERLMAALTPAEEGTRRLSASAWSQARDIAEIWLATQTLYTLEPGLSGLPDEIAARVAGLPTELWRRGAGKI